MTEDTPPENRRPLITHNYRKRSLTTWLVPLAVIIAIMIFLPKLIDMLEK